MQKNSNLESIETDNLKFNLKNKDIDSKNQVILYGKNFFSIGNGIHSNLLTKNTIIINKVRTYYDIKKKKK